jgi:hypothetical protein
MSNIRKNDRHDTLSARTWRVRRLATWLSRLVLHRAMSKAVQSIEHHAAQEACLLRDIGIDPSDAERLASEFHVLAADLDRISIKPNATSSKPKPRSR